MPLSEKGDKIMSAMQKTYGEKEGESVFYASKNAGKISGVDEADASASPDYSSGGVGGMSINGKEKTGYSIHTGDEPAFKQAGPAEMSVVDINREASRLWSQWITGYADGEPDPFITSQPTPPAP